MSDKTPGSGDKPPQSGSGKADQTTGQRDVQLSKQGATETFDGLGVQQGPAAGGPIDGSKGNPEAKPPEAQKPEPHKGAAPPQPHNSGSGGGTAPQGGGKTGATEKFEGSGQQHGRAAGGPVEGRTSSDSRGSGGTAKGEQPGANRLVEKGPAVADAQGHTARTEGTDPGRTAQAFKEQVVDPNWRENLIKSVPGFAPEKTSNLKENLKEAVPGGAEKSQNAQENLKNVPGGAEKSQNMRENVKNVPGGAEAQAATEAWNKGDLEGAAKHGGMAAIEFGVATAGAIAAFDNVSRGIDGGLGAPSTGAKPPTDSGVGEKSSPDLRKTAPDLGKTAPDLGRGPGQGLPKVGEAPDARDTHVDPHLRDAVAKTQPGPGERGPASSIGPATGPKMDGGPPRQLTPLTAEQARQAQTWRDLPKDVNRSFNYDHYKDDWRRAGGTGEPPPHGFVGPNGKMTLWGHDSPAGPPETTGSRLSASGPNGVDRPSLDKAK